MQCQLAVSFPSLCGHKSHILIASTSAPSSRSSCHISFILPPLPFVLQAPTAPYYCLQQTLLVPECVIIPHDTEDIADTVRVLIASDCPFTVKSGGHGAFAGASSIDGRVVIDLGRLNIIHLEQVPEGTYDKVGGNSATKENRVAVRVGSGARWLDVYKYLEAHGLTVSWGRDGGIGVGGSVLGGGISFTPHIYGWSCDTVLSFSLLLPNLTHIQVTPSTAPDLFFALRGGGNNLGIVTSFLIQTFRQGPVWSKAVVYPIEKQDVVLSQLESSTKTSTQEEMILVAFNFKSSFGDRLTITKVVVDARGSNATTAEDGGHSNSEKDPGFIVENQLRNISAVAEEMDMMNPRGYYSLFASLTFKNSAALNSKIVELFARLGAIKMTGTVDSCLVFNPLSLETIKITGMNGGNTFGIGLDDGPLTILNINMRWSNNADTPLMNIFIRKLVEYSTQISKEMGLHHPSIFQNHAGEFQDMFAGYSEENSKRLLRIQQDVDPNGVFQRLQPGYFRLGKSAVNRIASHDEL